MDFSAAYQYIRPQAKLTLEELLSELRRDLAAELDAVNLYQAHYDATDNQAAREVLAHIRDEEKEHAAEFMALINQFDDVQRAMFASEHAAGIQGGVSAGLTTRPHDPTSTVGDLFGQKQP